MKIKIKATGEIIDALINSVGDAKYFNRLDHMSWLDKNEYEIIAETAQPKFKLGDVVSYTDCNKEVVLFEIKSILINEKFNTYSNSVYMDATDLQIDESHLTLYTEPEKQKNEIRYQYKYKTNFNSDVNLTATVFRDNNHFKVNIPECFWFQRIDIPHEVPL